MNLEILHNQIPFYDRTESTFQYIISPIALYIYRIRKRLRARFHRAMHVVQKRRVAIVSCPSVCLSVCASATLTHRDPTGWVSSKVIKRTELSPLDDLVQAKHPKVSHGVG